MTSTNAPSAFIPFCAYNTELLALGIFIDGMKFPICSRFVPTVLKGQLCYTMDVNSVLPDKETKAGKSSGLTLLLDYNQERSVLPKKQKQGKKSIERYVLDLNDNRKEEAKIFINTLKAFNGYGGGRYSMHSLKKISPTKEFLTLPKDVIGCANEEKQFCKMTKYLHHKLDNCKCIPWEFPKNGGEKVRHDNHSF